MGTDVAEVEDQVLKSRSFKVHHSICTEFAEYVDKCSRMISEIEATRPGSTGMQVLSSLTLDTDKAKTLLHQCSNSSKLYLAITSKKFLQRCNILKKKLEKRLCEIQDRVPVMLATQISQLIADLRNAYFRLDSSDEEAGNVLWELLRENASATDSQELGALQFAASRLNITTQKELIKERRSIKKLLCKVGDSDPKRKNLDLLLDLLNKHGNNILRGEKDNASAHHEINFCSQHSSMESASPRSLNTSWSNDSLGSSIMDLSTISLASLDSDVSNSLDARITNGINRSITESHERGAKFLSCLSRFPWESQCRIIEDLKSDLQYNDQAFSYLSSDNFIEPLLKYMRDAQECCDLKAQRAGFQLLMEFLSKSRIEIPYLHEEAFHVVASFLNSEVSEEALSILELLSGLQYHRFRINATDIIKAIVQFLNSQNRDLQEKAIKLLYILSLRNDVPLDIVSLECIPKLVSFLDDSTLAGCCIMTLRNLCHTKEGRLCFSERNECIESVVKLLDVGSHEVQEHGLALLLSLCSQNFHYSILAMDAGIIPSLFYISVNGNDRGKVYAFELLRLLRD